MTSTRSGLTALLCLFLAGTCGCFLPRDLETHKSVSPDGRTEVIVQWSGGSIVPTASSFTVVYMRRRCWFLPLFGIYHRVAMIQRSPAVKPVWESNKLLTIRLTPEHGPYHLAWRKAKMFDVEIKWIEIDGDAWRR